MVVWSPGMDPRAVAGLASRRTYPLRSSFRPSYNMAVNLVDRLGRAAARDLLEQSFAQYQANARGGRAGPAGHPQRARPSPRTRARMQCHLGDTARVPGPAERTGRRGEGRSPGPGRPAGATRRPATWPNCAAATSSRCRPVGVPGWRSCSIPASAPDGSARPLVVTAGRWAGRLTAADFRGPVPRLGRLRLGKFTDHRSPKVRRDVPLARCASRDRQRRDRGAAAAELGRGDGPDRAAQGDPGASGARLRRPGRSTCSGPAAGAG